MYVVEASKVNSIYLHEKQNDFNVHFEYVPIYEPRSEKTGLRGFRPGPTQTGLYSHRRWLES